MGIVGWIIVGLLVGAIVTSLRPHRRVTRPPITILIAVAGAVVGGFVGDSLEVGHVESSFDVESFAAAATGAIVMLAAYRLGGGRV